jgi:hypothetical protein
VDAAIPVAVVGLVWLLRDTRWFRVLVGEDALFEWAQVGAFVVAAVCLALAALRTHGRVRAWYGACAGVVGVAIGEELAWGTRLLDVDLSIAANDQGEATVHNIGQALDASFLAVTAVAVVLLAVVVARHRRDGRGPLALAVWFAVPAVYAALRLVDGDPGYAFAKLSEATELVLAVAMARMARAELLHTEDAASVARWSAAHGGLGGDRWPWKPSPARPPGAPTA